MTISSTLSIKTYLGNGLNVEYSVPFPVLKNDTTGQYNLVLLITNEDETQIEVPNSDYRVNEVQAPSASNRYPALSVTYPISGDPLALGKKLTIYRQTPITQEVDLTNAGNFNAEVLEYSGFDKQTMINQEQQDGINRGIKVPIGFEDPPELLAEQIFQARDTALDSANIATEQAVIATEQAELAILQLPLVIEAKDNALVAITDATTIANNSITIHTETKINQLNSITTTNIEAISTAKEQALQDITGQVSIAENFAIEAQKWAIADISVLPQGSAKYWAGIAQSSATGVPDASTTIKGKAMLATDSDIEIGTNEDKIVNPKQLFLKVADGVSIANGYSDEVGANAKSYTDEQIANIPAIEDATTTTSGKVRLATTEEIASRIGNGAVTAGNLPPEPTYQPAIRTPETASTTEAPTEKAVAEALDETQSIVDTALANKANADLSNATIGSEFEIILNEKVASKDLSNVTELSDTFKELVQTAGLSGEATVIETWTGIDPYYNSINWYRKWSDGFIEQRLIISSSGSSSMHNFLTPFTKAENSVFLQKVFSSANNTEYSVLTITKTSFTVDKELNSGPTSQYLIVYACGY